MDAYEIAVIEDAMECAKAQHALDCGTPAQPMLKKATANMLSACADLAAENDGDWSAPEPTPDWTLRRFHNALRVLLNIDMAEFIEAVFEKDYGEFGDEEKDVWKAFKTNRHMWFIRAPDAYADKLWTYMQTRMK